MNRMGRLLSLLTMAASGVSLGAAKEDISPICDAETLAPGEVREPWVLTSRTAAVVYWQTANRCRSRLEYGPDRSCSTKTPTSGASAVSRLPHWTQVHRVRGLQPNSEVFYRRVCLGTDGKEVRGPVETFRTKPLGQAIRVPDDLAGPPYVLDRKGATYVLTKDLTMPLGGIRISAAGVTLDMDGHTLVYNDQPADRPGDWSQRAYCDAGHDFGINVTVRGAVRVLNGVIRQGRGQTPGTSVGIGCNPLYARSGSVELAGMEIVWSGRDISGVFLHWAAGSHVHHCVMEDTGRGITNRHQAISTIDGNAYGRYDHNLVKRTRQQGLVGAATATHNEIYVDSCATNAFGITGSARSPKPVEVAHNRILGIGQHPVGIGMFKAYKPGTAVHHNLVEVKCTRSGPEYGYTGSACFRTTWGGDNLDVHDNTFIAHADVYGGKAAKTRAVWVGLPKFTPKGAAAPIADARGIFRSNYIAALGRKGAKAGGICVVCLNDSPNLIFLQNTVVSTWGNVLLGDGYGHAGGYAKFVGNTFRRVGKQTDYHTIRHEHASQPGTGVFLGNTYEDGATAESVRLQKGGRIVIQDVLEIQIRDTRGKPVAGARATVRDRSGTVLFTGVSAGRRTEGMLACAAEPGLSVRTPPRPAARGYVASVLWDAGVLRTVVTREVLTATRKDTHGPYTVTVMKDGYSDVRRTVDAVALRELEIVLVPRGR